MDCARDLHALPRQRIRALEVTANIASKIHGTAPRGKHSEDLHPWAQTLVTPNLQPQ